MRLTGPRLVLSAERAPLNGGVQGARANLQLGGSLAVRMSGLEVAVGLGPRSPLKGPGDVTTCSPLFAWISSISGGHA